MGCLSPAAQAPLRARSATRTRWCSPQSGPAAPEDPCHYCYDSCYWLSAEFQVWENKPATLLSTIGHHYGDVKCGDKQHEYKLVNGE